MNAIKISAIAEHLVINQSCAKSLKLERFKIIKSGYNVFDLIKLVKIEAICILKRKSTLCRQKELDNNLLERQFRIFF